MKRCTFLIFKEEIWNPDAASKYTYEVDLLEGLFQIEVIERVHEDGETKI